MASPLSGKDNNEERVCFEEFENVEPALANSQVEADNQPLEQVENAEPPAPAVRAPAARPVRKRARRERLRTEDVFLQENLPALDGEVVTNQYTHNPGQNRNTHEAAFIHPYDSSQHNTAVSKRYISEIAERSTTPPSKPDYVIYANINSPNRQGSKSIAEICHLKNTIYNNGGPGKALNAFCYWKKAVYVDYDRWVLNCPSGWERPRILVGKKRKAFCNKNFAEEIDKLKRFEPGSDRRRVARSQLFLDTIRHNNILSAAKT